MKNGDRDAPDHAYTIDRARGVLVGLAVGDALGAPVEFDSPEEIRGRREELFAMPGGGGFDWAPGEFTDDTQMTLVLARHLRSHAGEVDQAELASEFARWAVGARDVGNQTREVLDAVRAGSDWRAAVARLSPEKAGNGSLMRVAPVALVASSPAAARTLARAQSEVTHPNETCLDACSAFAWTLWTTMATGLPSLEAITRSATTDAVRKAIRSSGDDAAPEMSGWVIHTLTGALWAVRGAESFEDAVWRAVCLGGDADTVGAVAGALAGAVWGLDAIPPSLSGALQSRNAMFIDHYPEALVALADGLVGARAG